jgi:uncharacterized protein (DUF2249 family)
MTAIGVVVQSLDLRSLPAPGRVSAVFAAFDSLLPGEPLLVLCDEDLDPVLVRLQAERPGAFEWSPLDDVAGVRRVEVARREAAGLRDATEALSWDHDRLDDLEGRAFRAREAGDHAEAQRLFRTFAAGLRRHIGFEEHLLFPEFEARAHMPHGQGPTAVMRSEHREIESLLDRIEARIADPEAERGLREARQMLHQVLGDHNAKEEQVLYPGIDRLMSKAERDDLVRRIQAYPG